MVRQSENETHCIANCSLGTTIAAKEGLQKNVYIVAPAHLIEEATMLRASLAELLPL
jgi:hypothetical protein